MSTWDSPEHRALDDAQMELNIAADRWHDFPFSEEAANDLRSAIKAYRVARDAWVRLVAGPADADLVDGSAGAMPAPAAPPQIEQPDEIEEVDLLGALSRSLQRAHADRHRVPADRPTPCAACGHEHAGPETGGICVGCPCEGAKA